MTSRFTADSLNCKTTKLRRDVLLQDAVFELTDIEGSRGSNRERGHCPGRRHKLGKDENRRQNTETLALRSR